MLRNVRGRSSLIAASVLAAACAGSAAELADPVTVVSSGASNPTVAVDGDHGIFYVAWVGTRDGEPNVYVARSEDGVAFSEPVRANDIDGDAAPHEQAPAQIATGPDGAVYVVWQNNTVAEGRRFPYSDLRFARSTDGARTFEPAITVNDDAAGPPSSHTFHDLAVGADGRVYVSWIDSRVRTRLEAAQAGAAPESGHVAPPTQAAAAAMAGGGAHAGHGMPGLPGPEIRIARSTDGGRSFGASEVIASDACPCCRTSLTVGPAGDVAVAWRAVYDGDIRDVVVARSSAGQGFGPPARVHSDGWSISGCPHAGPDLVLDEAGRTHVAWYTGAPDRQGLYYAVAGPGSTTFSEPRPLLVGGWIPVSQVKLAATRDGVVIAWDDRRTEMPKVQVAVASADGAPATIAESLPGASPAVAASAGQAAVAWLDGEAVRFATVRQ